MRRARQRFGLFTAVLALVLGTIGTAVATPVTTSAPADGGTLSLGDTAAPLVVPTKLTAKPVTLSLGPRGALRLFPSATLTNAVTGEPLPPLSLGDPGRTIVFSVADKIVCTAIARHPNGVATCRTPRAALAVVRNGGYDAHFAGLTYGGFDFLPSDAHGPFIG